LIRSYVNSIILIVSVIVGRRSRHVGAVVEDLDLDLDVFTIVNVDVHIGTSDPLGYIACFGTLCILGDTI
jgi:hypothetical protein